VISEYEAEHWRQMSDELVGQSQRLAASHPTTRAEWQAIDAIQSASRSLFSAFATIMRDKQDRETS
jgi:hypothetical protein